MLTVPATAVLLLTFLTRVSQVSSPAAAESFSHVGTGGEFISLSFLSPCTPSNRLRLHLELLRIKLHRVSLARRLARRLLRALGPLRRLQFYFARATRTRSAPSRRGTWRRGPGCEQYWTATRRPAATSARSPPAGRGTFGARWDASGTCAGSAARCGARSSAFVCAGLLTPLLRAVASRRH